MRKLGLLLGLVLILSTSCGSSSSKSSDASDEYESVEISKNKKNKKSKSKKSSSTVIEMDLEMFFERVFDFTVEDVNDIEFLGDLPVLIDFSATWCGPCQNLAPILDELAEEYSGEIVIYKVDVDQEPDLSELFEVTSLPTLLFIPMDDEPTTIEGAPTKSKLKKAIEDRLL